ncbi:MAG: hypothetical protein AB7O57_10530 [Hyphomicrobiaceae bacterium]
MSSMIIWVLGIGISVAALVITAAMKQYLVHMGIAAMISILFALASFRDEREPAAGGSVEHDLDGPLRHMGLVWAWGALALLVTYAFDILAWREWWQFFIAFFVLAGLSLFLSATLRKDAESGTGDEMLIKVARGFSIFVLVAMAVTMIGLLIDGKMWRFTTIAGNRRGSQDWAANNVFFFGAMALAAISWNAVRRTRRPSIKAA